METDEDCSSCALDDFAGYAQRIAACMREQFPDEPVFRALSEDSRLVVSEPLGELEGAWEAFPESSWCVIQPGRDEMADFRPQPPG